MDNSYKFFENKDCKYFPCHEGLSDFNCLFCYCPMYTLKNCPGTYEIIEKNGKQIKSCLNCNYPHNPNNYDAIMKILSKNLF